MCCASRAHCTHCDIAKAWGKVLILDNAENCPVSRTTEEFKRDSRSAITKELKCCRYVFTSNACTLSRKSFFFTILMVFLQFIETLTKARHKLYTSITYIGLYFFCFWTIESYFSIRHWKHWKLVFVYKILDVCRSTETLLLVQTCTYYSILYRDAVQ